MNPNDWVMSLDNPTRARYVAARLWKQGLRSCDRTIIELQYGYTEHETDIICKRLAGMEAQTKDYNPEIGF